MRTHVVATEENERKRGLYCDGAHGLFKCPEFINQPVNERRGHPGRVHLLLGSNLFGEILLDGVRKENGLVAQKTIFGWIISGNAVTNVPGLSVTTMHLQLDTSAAILGAGRRFTTAVRHALQMAGMLLICRSGWLGGSLEIRGRLQFGD